MIESHIARRYWNNLSKTKGLGDMLDKYENDILDKKSDHDLQCCNI